MSWEYFILFAIAALVCWALGAFAALERYKNGMGLWIYFLRSGYFLQFHYRNVDFIRTSSDADNGRDTAVVFFLPSVGGIDNLCTLEV